MFTYICTWVCVCIPIKIEAKNDVNAQYIVHFLFLHFYCKMLITHISICTLRVMHTQARTQPHTHTQADTHTHKQTLCILAALQQKICAINICIQLALESSPSFPFPVT